jgi:hypothetical protein
VMLPVSAIAATSFKCRISRCMAGLLDKTGLGWNCFAFARCHRMDSVLRRPYGVRLSEALASLGAKPDELAQHFGIHFDGLLGQDILNQFRSVRIDYETHTIDLER